MTLPSLPTCAPPRTLSWLLPAFVLLVLFPATMIFCQDSVAKPNAAARPPEAVAELARGILSNRCFACHGPDEESREGGIRFDVESSYLGEADSGERAVVSGSLQESELWNRISSKDEDQRMPPPHFGAALDAEEMEVLRKWIEQGAQLPEHWAFVPPTRPAVPTLDEEELAPDWLGHPIDRFVRAQQIAHGMPYSQPAERSALLRRLALDLTGLPPDPASVKQFANDDSPDAYIRQVDRLLADPAYGEHWARKWLDLARYADSAGYADDPARTIWGYRDWVIRAINANMSLHDFTIKQLAGDLLETSSNDDLVATAFHRNTLTNNEGGTNNEEFRNVAVVDRVNTTMAVWMGVTMACAQCHTHKYDPFTQAEYFQLFAIFNQTEDADRRDESPTIAVYSQDQLAEKQRLLLEEQTLESELREPTEELLREFAQWKRDLAHVQWEPLQNPSFSAEGLDAELDETGQIHITTSKKDLPAQSVYEIEYTLPASQQPLQALKLQTLPGTRNFVVTNLSGELRPVDPSQTAPARFVRIEVPGENKILSLAEVQVLSQGENIATTGKATQSSTDYSGPAELAIDGNTSGNFDHNSTTHTKKSNHPWWELDLLETRSVEQLVIWNRTDNNLQSRLAGARLQLLDANRAVVFSQSLDAPKNSLTLPVEAVRPVTFRLAEANYEQSGFPASAVIDGDPKTGWAIAGRTAQSNALTLVPAQPLPFAEDMRLTLRIAHESPHTQHLLEHFQISSSRSRHALEYASLDQELKRLIREPANITPRAEHKLRDHFATRFAPSTKSTRDRLANIRGRLTKIKPATTVPIMRERGTKESRETFVQIRGNYKSLGEKVGPATPEVFHPVASTSPAGPNRLDLARWLVDRRNPLTARVWVNRMWESLFGIGLVRSSEEFGSQGDRPSHPKLLDWLAVEFMESGWDNKHLLRLILTSQTYQQTSAVSEVNLQKDQDNIWLSRGPRVRLSAEMVRDQALAASGLLSRTLYGPPVRPPQPDMGLTAAFGSKTDWSPSKGANRYRRGIYTTWRRSNPYPSMATFDAPSREVCTLRRDSTNTPLQALVTLNDPAFFEAAQGLARLALRRRAEVQDSERIRWLFERVTQRLPNDSEVAVLEALLTQSKLDLAKNEEAAKKLATEPIGALPAGSEVIEYAAYSALCNVLLNLDEVLMKR